MTDLPPTQHARWKFDPTVNLGHVISFAAMLVTLITMFVGFDARLKAMEVQMQTYNANFERIVSTAADVRSLNSRMDRVENRLESIR